MICTKTKKNKKISAFGSEFQTSQKYPGKMVPSIWEF